MWVWTESELLINNDQEMTSLAYSHSHVSPSGILWFFVVWGPGFLINLSDVGLYTKELAVSERERYRKAILKV